MVFCSYAAVATAFDGNSVAPSAVPLTAYVNNPVSCYSKFGKCDFLSFFARLRVCAHVGAMTAKIRENYKGACACLCA